MHADFRGLDDDDVACGECGEEGDEAEVDGVVPRRYGQHHPVPGQSSGKTQAMPKGLKGTTALLPALGIYSMDFRHHA